MDGKCGTLTVSPLIGIVDLLASSHLRADKGVAENLKSMVNTGELKSVTDLALALARIDRPDALLRVVREHMEEIDLTRRDKIGRTLEDLVAREERCCHGVHKDLYGSVLAAIGQLKKSSANGAGAPLGMQRLEGRVHA